MIVLKVAVRNLRIWYIVSGCRRQVVSMEGNMLSDSPTFFMLVGESDLVTCS